MYKNFILSLFFILLLGNGSVFAQGRLQDSLALVELFDSTDGHNWTDTTNWNNGPLDTWYGVTVTGNRVTQLYLGDNNLVGTIPPSIGDLDSLRILWLNDNELTGPIPTEIGNLTNLTYLRLKGNELTGSIPTEIGNLTNLEYLFLNLNQLTGSIPTEICSLTNLIDLYLNSNQLTGSIPSGIGSLTDLQYLYLDNNQLTDSIPSGFGSLTSLIRLGIANNQLTGAVPSGFSSLTDLERLFLNNNDLIDLPSLTALSLLQYLYIHNNKFTFEDIEPNIGVPSIGFVYSPQDSVGEAWDTTVDLGSSLTISVSVGGGYNLYQWIKDGDTISGAEDSVYTMDPFDSSDAGLYICEITNDSAVDLTLYSKPITVSLVSAVPNPELPEVYSMSVIKGIITDNNLEVRYALPEKAKVRFSIYDIRGAKVRELSEENPAGVYSVKIDMSSKPAGIYFLKVEANDRKFTGTGKILLM